MKRGYKRKQHHSQIQSRQKLSLYIACPKKKKKKNTQDVEKGKKKTKEEAEKYDKELKKESFEKAHPTAALFAEDLKNLYI